MPDPLLTYSDADEQSIFGETQVELGREPHIAHLSATTVAGDVSHPNEDTYAVVSDDSLLYLAVFDGATSLKSIGGLENETGAHLASHVVRDEFADATAAGSPTDTLLQCNKQLQTILSAVPGTQPDDPLTLPGTAATMGVIDWDEQRLRFGHVSDGFCIVWFTDGASELLTDDYNAEFDQAMFDYIVQRAREEGVSNREGRALPDVHEKLRQITTRKVNKPDGLGTGVLNGDEGVAVYIQEEAVSLEGVQSVLFATDGFVTVDGDVGDSEYRYWLRKQIRHGGLDHFIRLKKESENADPDWEHARYKHSDDATAILLEL